MKAFSPKPGHKGHTREKDGTVLSSQYRGLWLSYTLLPLLQVVVREVRGSEGVGRTSQGVLSMATAFIFSRETLRLFFKAPQCGMPKEPRTAGKTCVVIVDQGEVMVMLKADQGFCEVNLSQLVIKLLLEMLFFLQFRFFHITNEKW